MMLHHSCLSMSYSSINFIITSLADSTIEKAQDAAFGPHTLAYNNINISTSIFVEQKPKHILNVSRSALRSSTARSIGVSTAMVDEMERKDTTQHGRHGLFLNVQIWYRSVFAFLTGQLLKMGIL